MKYFTGYLRSRKKALLFFALCLVTVCIVIVLYGLPLTAALYPALLCIAAGLLFAVPDYLNCRAKHAELEKLSRTDAAMMTGLPEAGEYGQDYVSVINALREEVTGLQNAYDEKYRDLSDYYGMWAHQIKTPIASMKLTLAGEDSPAARKLTAELNSIERYVGMVLAYVRLDSSANDYSFREYEGDDIIRQSVRAHASDFIDKKLRLDYRPVDTRFVTDEKWFSFVLDQLLSNALKYTKQGCVCIYKTDEGLLCIEDTGIGIAPEDLPRIFEKGYTGFNGRLDKSASGLGLYLSRRICDNLGIGISAQSVPGEGTKILLDVRQPQIKHE